MNLLVIIKRNSIVGYFSDRDQPTSVIMPQTAIRAMEVVNEKECSALLENAFGGKSAHPSASAILVLSDELCFSESSVPKEEEKAVATLTNIVPFAKIATSRIHVPDTTIVIAANADLYETIAHIFTEIGYPVVMVVPWAALVQAGISAHGEVDKVTVRRVFDVQSQLKVMSLPCETVQSSNEVPVVSDHVAPQPKKISKGIIIFGILALIYALFMVWYMLRH